MTTNIRRHDLGAADRWRQSVLDRAVPQSILDQAPEPQALLEPEMFRWRPEQDAQQPVRPSRKRALEALPPGGTVLDVGVGGGASSLGLAPTVSTILGVDPHPGMLEQFEASARECGVVSRPVLGSWPEVAAEVEPADVAVCHHAVYGVEQIEDFLLALTSHARHRVVLEVSEHPPLFGINPLWKAFHGRARPDWRVGDEAFAVLQELGLSVEREDLALPGTKREVTPQFVAFVRRRLYVGPEHDAQIEDFLRQMPAPPHTVVALWWPGGA